MKRFSFSFLFILTTITLFAQTPQSFKYQAVLRDNAGAVIVNQSVGVRISIHDATATGTIVYRETFAATTNAFGIVDLEIGQGTPVSGIFAGIDWGANPKFIETEIDVSGGQSYISMGTSQLLSVPYALLSDRSNNDAWEKSGNDIYYNNGNAGIGTATPGDKIHAYGNAPAIRLQDQADNTSYSSLQDGSPAQLLLQKKSNNSISLIDIDPQPLDGSSDARVRFFRL